MSAPEPTRCLLCRDRGELRDPRELRPWVAPWISMTTDARIHSAALSAAREHIDFAENALRAATLARSELQVEAAETALVELRVAVQILETEVLR